MVERDMCCEGGAEADRQAARRRQVLDAAAQCFRTHGFHGASMAQISRAAGMSVGHIYHYFENKEALIGAIVQNHLESMLAMMDSVERAGPDSDILMRLVTSVEVGVSQYYDPGIAALMLEGTSEGARNPKVAAMLREADEIARLRFRDVLRRGSCKHADLGEAELDSLVFAIKCLFEGLWVRTVRQPDLDRRVVARAVADALRRILPVT